MAEREMSPTSSVDAAFDALYRSQRSAMVRLALLMTGSMELSEDLVHDAFVRVHRAWGRVEQPVPYLRRAVVNTVLEHLRRERMRLHLPQDRVEPALPHELDEVWTELGHLPDRQRQALVLRFYLDLPFSEIADLLGCRTSTARSLVHRGIDHMKERLRP